jgi:hypothetical protein
LALIGNSAYRRYLRRTPSGDGKPRALKTLLNDVHEGFHLRVMNLELPTPKLPFGAINTSSDRGSLAGF